MFSRADYIILLPLFFFQLDSALLRASDLPVGVINTQNPNDVSLTPEESLSRITVPDGFKVTLFAGEPDLRRPIAFDIDDRGRLWVVENYSHPEWDKDNTSDRIVILEDTNHDGQFDQRRIFWDQGRYLTGIALGLGGVWIANTPELAFIPDRDRDDVPDGDPIVKLDGFRVSSNNVVNNFHWGPDGWLYGAIGLGSVSLVGTPESEAQDRTGITRGIWRYHPTEERFEVVAEGMVNPWGADFNQFGDLFTANTVIAHLFHIVPGMYCQRRDNEVSHPHVYEQIQSITDHLHWGGGVWQSSRETTDAHSVAGGGHAHCGAMIYQGDNWPDPYRNQFFTLNLHGNRINMDHLEIRRSGYVGVHGEDFMFANDPWFRGMSMKYGPDGGVFVSDWHDFGECHDSDGSHRTTGRIYKIVYGSPEKENVDLAALSSQELATLHEHKNEWFVRHARRLLQERATEGVDSPVAERTLRAMLVQSKPIEIRLRAFWTLNVMNRLSESELITWLQDPNEHLRRWAVRFLSDRTTPGEEAQSTLANLASIEASAKVRLELASALQRLSKRWALPLAKGLLQHGEDAQDPYIPLMIWYGIEPLLRDDPTTSLQLAAVSKIGKIREFLVRRSLSREAPPIEQTIRALSQQIEPSVTKGFLSGMLAALEQEGSLLAPDSWPSFYQSLSEDPDSEIRTLLVRLATIFGDDLAIKRLQKTVSDQNARIQARQDALAALLKIESGLPVTILHQLIRESSAIRRDAIQALMMRNTPETDYVLVKSYGALSSRERQDALGVLATRSGFAATLLTAIQDGTIPRDEISSFVLQQLRTFKDAAIQRRVKAIWSDATDQIEKSDEIARYKALMTDDYLERGDAKNGRLLFEQNCSNCHTLFDEGGRIGPDLTGSGRADLDYILSNLIDPNAVIDDAYRLTTLDLEDGQVLSGFMEQLGDRFMIFRTPQGSIKLPMSQVESIQTSGLSMMPERMLHALKDEQVRDLLLYLRSEDQVTLPVEN
ncbi:c-type cytochrome [bacterium]|nr:c-type cytochrome [bacterium]